MWLNDDALASVQSVAQRLRRCREAVDRVGPDRERFQRAADEAGQQLAQQLGAGDRRQAERVDAKERMRVSVELQNVKLDELLRRIGHAEKDVPTAKRERLVTIDDRSIIRASDVSV